MFAIFLQQDKEERSGGEHAWDMQVPNFSITPVTPERSGGSPVMRVAAAHTYGISVWAKEALPVLDSLRSAHRQPCL
jgi:hypothetical protein